MDIEKHKAFDSHHHIWSDGKEPFPWVVEPIDELKSTSTAEDYLRSVKIENDALRDQIEAENVNPIRPITKSLIVQPLNHKFDHSYLFETLKKYPRNFLGMALANPDEGVDGLKRIKETGPDNLVSVRFNPTLFPSGNLESDLAGDMFSESGKLNLVVGVMCFTGITTHVSALRKWAVKYKDTKVVIDHMGFFRQPAVGAVIDTPEKSHNNEDHWEALMTLADVPNVYVKISALFRLSGEPFPHHDLREKRVKQLVDKFGPDRLMWGSDWPYVLTGNQMGMTNFNVKDLNQAVTIFDRWNDEKEVFSEETIQKIMFQTAFNVFSLP